MSMFGEVVFRRESAPLAVPAVRRGAFAAHSDRFDLRAAGLLLAITLAGHVWSLGDAPFLDDHLHQDRLRSISMPPRPHDLLRVTTIAPDDFIHCWWQEKTNRWQYARPFSVLVMKTVHWLGGGAMLPQHLASLAMHYAIVLLVFYLCMTLTRQRFWSIFGAALFALYTHTIIPVGWLAAQNAILQTLLTLTAMMLYARASGLDLSPDTRPPSTGPMQSSAFAGVILCAVLSILSREVGVVLPLLTLAMDLAYGGRDHARRRRGAHLTLAAISLSFMLWRFFFFFEPIPDFYARRPDEPGFLTWCTAKLLHYLASAVWLTPMTIGPTGRFDPFRETPGDCLLMTGIILFMSAGYYLACRNIRGWWIWPLWILLSVLPVVPIMATPHTGYMTGVGFAIAMVIGPALRATARPVSIGRWSRPVAGWFMFATLVYVVLTNLTWEGLQSAERATLERLTMLPAPRAEQRHTFFVNLPFVNIYTPIAMRGAWGDSADRTDYHVLTYSPDVLYVEGDCTVEQTDDRSFTVEITGRPYFAGALGRYLIEAMRIDRHPLATGRRYTSTLHPGAPFHAEVIGSDSSGVRKLKFVFEKPLASPEYRFIVATRDDPAAELHFRPDVAAPTESKAPIAAVADSVRQAAELRPQTAGAATDEALNAFVHDRDRIARLQARSHWVAQIRDLVGKAIRSDLYFTGPPFPSPR